MVSYTLKICVANNRLNIRVRLRWKRCRLRRRDRFSTDSRQSLFFRLEVADHEAGEDRHHHLSLDLDDVLGQSVHSSADLASDGDGVLSVFETFLLRYTVTKTKSGAETEGGTLRNVLCSKTSSFRHFSKKCTLAFFRLFLKIKSMNVPSLLYFTI